MLTVLLLTHLAVSDAQSTQLEWQDAALDAAKCGEGDGVCLLQSRRFLERIDESAESLADGALPAEEGFAEEVAEDKKQAADEDDLALDLRMAAELALLGAGSSASEVDCMGKGEEEDAGAVATEVFSTGRQRNRYGHKNTEVYACCDGEHVALDVDLSRFKSPRTDKAAVKACAEAASVPSKRAPEGFSHIMINQDGECIVPLQPGCTRTFYNTAMYNDYRGHTCLFTTTYSVHKKGMPVVEGISPTQGTPLGGTRVTITGKNLWSGVKQAPDMQDLAPPMVICLQGRRVCDIDYFASDAGKVECVTRGVDEVPPPLPPGPDEGVKDALSASDRLCAQLSHAAPDGYVTPKGVFSYVGTGWCDVGGSKRIAQVGRNPSQAWCEAETLKRGGKAYVWRPYRAGCTIYADYCSKPRAAGKASWKFKVFSLHTPVAAMFFKLNGGYVGGPVTGTWNVHSPCFADTGSCGFEYMRESPARLFHVDPQVAGPGGLLRIVGDFLRKNVTNTGKVLLQPVAQEADGGVICELVDVSGTPYPMTHT
jgi:hypothetical protein